MTFNEITTENKSHQTALSNTTDTGAYTSQSRDFIVFPYLAGKRQQRELNLVLHDEVSHMPLKISPPQYISVNSSPHSKAAATEVNEKK